MPTYAIGDVQGCFEELQTLLQHINFDAKTDTLWFTGDLINRGPQSLETLRFVTSLGDKHKTVLGNHDLYFLSVAFGIKDTDDASLQDILDAPDFNSLIQWIKTRPLIHYDKHFNCILTHAGIAPLWDLDQAISLADEVHTVLQSAQCTDLLTHMWGDTPALWENNLSGWSRLRCIINYFTRMRYCDQHGALNLHEKGSKSSDNCMPWYLVPHRPALPTLVFGHWASLLPAQENREVSPDVFAIDTGCIWGNRLTALCLDTKKTYAVPGFSS